MHVDGKPLLLRSCNYNIHSSICRVTAITVNNQSEYNVSLYTESAHIVDIPSDSLQNKLEMQFLSMPEGGHGSPDLELGVKTGVKTVLITKNPFNLSRMAEIPAVSDLPMVRKAALQVETPPIVSMPNLHFYLAPN